MNFRQNLITSLACTVVFALVITACGGGKNSGSILDMGGSSTLKVFLAKAPILGSSVFARNSGSKIALASFLQIPTPVVTTFGQTFHGQCIGTATRSNTLSGQGYYLIGGLGSVDPALCQGPLVPNDPNNPAPFANLPSGTPIIDSGTLGNLIVFGNPSSNPVLVFVNGAPTQITCVRAADTRCQDRTHTAAVTDRDKIEVAEVVPAGGTTSGAIEVFLVKN
jgi:hypothetical protein